jgi:23S rRNA pseudouridine2605 synthase
MRLAKYLAHAGVASRRAAETIVGEGRVTVGGEVVRDPARDVGEGSCVEVDGKQVTGLEARVVYAVNKPRGVLSTASDPYERPTVVALLPKERRRLYPVGRLDADSTGLILLTNDGALAHRLTHPSFEVPKTYRVVLAGGPVERDALERLRNGVALDDGLTAPAHVCRISPGRTTPGRITRSAGGERNARGTRSAGGERGARGDVLEITIREGRNRQVRRMCEAVGHPVLALERIAFGSLRLGDLPLGAHRPLSQEELARLSEEPRKLAESGGSHVLLGLAESPANARAPTRPARRHKRRAR